MKKIVLWVVLVSLSTAGMNVTGEKVLAYESKTLYHLYVKEYALALEYAKLGCKLGSSESCSNVAFIYAEGYIDGMVNYFKAHQYYKKACTLKNSIACVNAGIFYEEGLGLNKGYVDHAKPYFSEGCLLGNGRACNMLGVIEYQEGNTMKAQEYLGKACLLKHEQSCKLLKKL